MSESDQTNPFRAQRYRDPEAQLGGADDVEKTTYVVGAGTEPERRKGKGPSASVSTSVPRGVLALVVALVFLVMVVYLLGIGR